MDSPGGFGAIFANGCGRDTIGAVLPFRSHGLVLALALSPQAQGADDAVALSPVASPAVVAPDRNAALVEAARRYLGRPYSFGGRGSYIDCMGLVFRAWTDAGRGDYRGLSVNPTELVSKRQLGAPVPGLSPVASHAVDYAVLRAGDVLFFLGTAENTNEPSLASLGGQPVWVWHMGLYSGGERRDFVVGDHYAASVVETSLPAYLANHPVYVGLFVVRPG